MAKKVSGPAETVNYSYLPQLVGHLVGLVHLRATQLHTELLASLALTPKQFVALEFIANNPHISQKEIAGHIGTTPAVMVNILDALTERGFVERLRSTQDRRCHHIRLTTEGAAILDRLQQVAFEAEESFAAETELTVEERDTFLRTLQKITCRQPESA